MTTPASHNPTGPPSSQVGSTEDGVETPHRLSMTLLMTPDLANFSGNVHGGQILKFLDQVAYTCGTRWSQSYVVTLSVDQVVFREPVHIGELLTLQASINYTGRTSMEVGIRVTTENLHGGQVRHTNSCYFTMVAVDENGRPVPVRPWVPRTPTERRRAAEARMRRELRLEVQRRTAQIKTDVAVEDETG